MHFVLALYLLVVLGFEFFKAPILISLEVNHHFLLLVSSSFGIFLIFWFLLISSTRDPELPDVRQGDVAGLRALIEDGHEAIRVVAFQNFVWRWTRPVTIPATSCV